MKKRISTMFILVLTLVISTAAFGIDDARLMRYPDINGDEIVFVYGGDLWTVSTDGGTAKKITTHKGVELSPYFSPDGKWIAFSGQYDGNTDVYIIPAEGGIPKRLTYHPYPDIVTGWTPDGKYVLFNSRRISDSYRYTRIFKVSIDATLPEPLPLPMAFYGSFSDDGKRYAYTPMPNAYRSWRRYRGGNAPFIWIFNFDDNSIQRVPHPNCNDTFPRWIGDEVIFLSDRDRVMNLYGFNYKTGELRQITKYTGPDIKTFGASKGNVVFEREGYLHLLDLKTGDAKKLTINIPAELLNTRPHFENAGKLIYSFNVSPTGKRAVFGARGEIVSVPAEKGDIRNLTNTPCKMEREPAWSPDGKSIAYFGEHDGEYALHIIDQKGIEDPKIIKMQDNGYYHSIKWSPDSKKLLFRDSRLSLQYYDLEEKKQVKIASDTYFRGFYEYTLNADWSPDSNWIVYEKLEDNFFHRIYLYSIKSEKSHPITDGMSEAQSPTFDKNGKYLYFVASTDKALDVAWADMSEYPHTPTSGLYAVILSADEPSPFKPESDEEEGEKKDEKKKDEKGKEKDEDKDKSIKVDLADIDQRIVAVDLPEKPYYLLQAGDNKFYYLEAKRGEPDGDIHKYDVEKRKDEVIASGVYGFKLSSDGKKIIYQTKGRQFYLIDASKKAKPGEGKLKTEAIETYSVPAKEWKQILTEAWRIQREFFYDPGMHGQDWDAIWNQYKEYIPFISHRTDLTYIIAQMIGELAIGHAYVGGGYRPDIDFVPGGLLGADYEIAEGHYRIKKIYYGENWNPKLRAPMTEPGVNIKEGEYILEVNGKPLDGTMNIFSLFEKTAGKQIRLKVNSKPNLKGARSVTVVPMGNEYMLRFRAWMENNRKKVEEMSKGRVGYVYLPNTSVAGFENFNRYYFAHVDKDGIVIDERFNGGGYAADYIVDHLDRHFLNYWKSRYGKPQWTPTASIFGPKTMIINEYAGSGGDLLPYYFNKRGLGKLVGKRTWGGVVGISGYPRLMDGGYVTSPTIGLVTEEGKFEVENYGIDPDIEVEITPADFIAGRDTQLEKAVKVVLDELKKNPPKELKIKSYPRGR